MRRGRGGKGKESTMRAEKRKGSRHIKGQNIECTVFHAIGNIFSLFYSSPQIHVPNTVLTLRTVLSFRSRTVPQNCSVPRSHCNAQNVTLS